jgi:hypothetical protein
MGRYFATMPRLVNRKAVPGPHHGQCPYWPDEAVLKLRVQPVAAIPRGTDRADLIRKSPISITVSCLARLNWRGDAFYLGKMQEITR